MEITFNKPYVTGREFTYIEEAIRKYHLSGDGMFTKKCQAWLEERIGSGRVFLTHSCTAALEMAAILADLGPGDEVIMPSYTFVSTANAFVLRGAVPVFVDIRPDTLNIDEKKIEEAITPRTRAIVVVHYAGVGVEMEPIMELAERRGLMIIEDDAQGIMCEYRGRPLGSFGALSALSFHETKNVISGEGGAIIVNDEALVERAEIIREKGTNRSRFFRGEVDKYTWMDIGSSFLPSDILAAFLWAQLEEAETITARRLEIWHAYDRALESLEDEGHVRRPRIPEHCLQNAHMYYVLAPDGTTRTRLLSHLKKQGIGAVFHYVPLHLSPAGQRFGRVGGELEVTEDMSERIIRLPLWIGMGEREISAVVGALRDFFR
jgi:dTDP-4-amino-4,6-dideoxygalactose transaminase